MSCQPMDAVLALPFLPTQDQVRSWLTYHAQKGLGTEALCYLNEHRKVEAQMLQIVGDAPQPSLPSKPQSTKRRWFRKAG